MQDPFCIYLSNRLETLVQFLKVELFHHSHPLAQRLVIVESPLMRSWLYWQMANDPDLRLATAINVSYLNPGLSSIFKKLGFGDEAKKIMRRETVALKLELLIHSMIQEEKWDTLREDLKIDLEKPLKPKHLRQILKLSTTSPSSLKNMESMAKARSKNGQKKAPPIGKRSCGVDSIMIPCLPTLFSIASLKHL